jgi:enoyl-CoA hydratase/carnithine racemase
MVTESIGIEVERKASLAIVTIARQDRLNAFNQAMFEALEDAARALSKGTLPRAVIITGAGPNAFCAGFDVNPDNPMVAEMARAVDRGEKDPITRSIAALRAAVDRFVALPVPIIAALNGKAYGGGAELAVRCDLRVMDPAAEICFSEVKLGLMPDWGGGATLSHLIGAASAADLILTARRIGADEALALGLVNRVSAPGNALNDAIAMAEAISRNGPRAVCSALKVIRAGRHLSLKETLDLEQRTAVDLIASGECLHGIGAFLSGETATFPDLLPEDTVE